MICRGRINPAQKYIMFTRRDLNRSLRDPDDPDNPANIWIAAMALLIILAAIGRFLQWLAEAIGLI